MRINEILPDLAQAPAKSPSPNQANTTQGTQGTLSPGEMRQKKAQQKAQKTQQQNRPSSSQAARDKDSTQQPAQAAKPRQTLRPGQTVTLPTTKGNKQEFKVTRDLGNEVEIENPDGAKSPSQPNKLVYNKADLEKAARGS